MKNWLIWEDPDAGKDWRLEKGTTGDEMVGWRHQLNGHEFQQTLRVGDGQGGLPCCSTLGWEESDTTEWLNWTDVKILINSLWSFKSADLKTVTISFNDIMVIKISYAKTKFYNSLKKKKLHSLSKSVLSSKSHYFYLQIKFQIYSSGLSIK